jgi:hypothetical protein
MFRDDAPSEEERLDRAAVKSPMWLVRVDASNIMQGAPWQTFVSGTLFIAIAIAIAVQGGGVRVRP